MTRVNGSTEQTSGRASVVVVVDLPPDLSAAETAQIIEERCGDFYLLTVIPWPGTGARAFFRKYAPKRETPDAAQTPEAKAARYANPDGKDEAAEAIIRKHMTMKPPRLADLLARHGIVRTGKWVYARQKKLERTTIAASALKA